MPPAAPASSLAGYALNQVNAARAAYGFAPLVLDAAVSAAAAAHAWDQAYNGYFSHYSLDGRTKEDRLRAQGVSFGWAGENQCYHVGMSEQSTLDWCHAQFMAEPYPGHWNHIGNILNPNARRMGVGIATLAERSSSSGTSRTDVPGGALCPSLDRITGPVDPLRDARRATGPVLHSLTVCRSHS